MRNLVEIRPFLRYGKKSSVQKQNGFCFDKRSFFFQNLQHRLEKYRKCVLNNNSGGAEILRSGELQHYILYLIAIY